MKHLIAASLTTLALVAGSIQANDTDATCAGWKQYAYNVHMGRSEGVSITEAMPQAREYGTFAVQVVSDAYDDMPVSAITTGGRQHEYAERFSERIAVRCYRALQ